MKKLRNLAMAVSIVTLIFSVVGFTPNPVILRAAHPPIHIKPGTTLATPTGYTPVQIKTAYGISQVASTGSGQTIAIVDAYGSPTIANDLAVFSKKFGLPSTNLTVAYPQGKITLGDAGWALETSLDVEWAHTIAPNAKILLVVAKSSSIANLLAAVDYATSHGAQVVSNSWGGSEFSSELSYESHFQHPGTVYVASSGDNGAGVEWPAVSPNVLSVGGTTLNVDSTGNYLSESGWSGSGGGVSSYEAVPSYQSNWSTIVGTHRGVPDVALNADPNTGIPVYDSTKYNRQSGWFEVGGTSFSAPVWAALIALADQGRTAPLTGINAITDLYNLAGTAGSTGYATNYNDITKGSNGQATLPGYDLVTGIGSLKGNSLIPNLTSALN